MKLVSFIPGKVDTLEPDIKQARLGVIKGEDIVDVALASNNTLPQDMISFLEGFDRNVEVAQKLLESSDASYKPSEVTLLSPVPRPTSMRDGYAFRQHVEAARRNRGVEMIPEFDLFPVFYFTNHNGVIGQGPMQVMPEHLQKLDFELEAAIVIGKKGRNIKASEADSYIAGYTIMNDWSARYLQMEEMKLSLGPAKGKDFATALGPWLVTKDELESKRIKGENGDRYDLSMTCTVNGKELSRGNLKDMTWTFAQLIERASYGVTLMPGDVIGSGTVGTGCLLELNGSKITDNLWIKVGDEVTCAIDLLGSLTNTVVAEKA
ncbi:MAG TPA: fumarylacetoacetate hydrolase family protein [Candidatus Kapabacteria bacterium]|nr:fumarylacetoacetate hydrolase family protein [Candidatus Kapabacteria bacterium]